MTPNGEHIKKPIKNTGQNTEKHIAVPSPSIRSMIAYKHAEKAM